MSSGASLTSWGEGASLALAGHPSSDGVTIKIPYTVDVLLHLLHSRETELVSSDRVASPSAGKNTRVVLVPYSRMEVRPKSYFWWCAYFWGPWVSFVTADEFSVMVTKITSKITSRISISWTHFLPFYFKPILTQWIMIILSKACKSDNFELHNSLKLDCTSIQSLRSNFVNCNYFLEWNSPDILPVCETNLDYSIDSGNFSARVYLPLSCFFNSKDF